VAGFLLACLPFLLPSGTNAFEYKARNISNNDINNGAPQICNGQVIWLSDQNSDGYYDSLWLYNGSNTIYLADGDDQNLWSAQLEGNRVVWKGSNNQIYLYQGGDISVISSNGVQNDSPKISGNQIIWRTDKNNDSYPETLVLYDCVQATIVTGLVEYVWDAAIDHGQIVWQAWDGEDGEIYLWRDGVLTQLSNNAISDWNAKICEGQVIWMSDQNGDNQADALWLFDGNNTVHLADGDNLWNARLDGGRVVWRGDDGEIYLYQGGSTENISNNGGSNGDPSISDGLVIWQSYMDYRLMIFDCDQGAIIGDTEPLGWDYSLNHGLITGVFWDWTSGKHEIFLAEPYYRPIIQVQPTPVNFGYVQLGQSATQTISLVNAGSTNLNIGEIALCDGPHLASFAIVNDTCSGQILAPGATGMVDVVFTPASLWGKAITLTVPSNDPDEPTNTIAVYGTGIDGSAAEISFQAGLTFLRDYNGSTHNITNLIDAHQSFETALAANTNHYGACLFEALTHLLTIVNDPDVGALLTRYGISETGRDLLNWSASIPDPLPTNAPMTGEALSLAIEKLRPAISNSLFALSHIPASWPGCLVVSPAEFPIDNEVEVDSGDIQMLQGGLEVMDSLLLILGGYDLNFDLASMDHLQTPRKTITVNGEPGDWDGISPLLLIPHESGDLAPNRSIRRVCTAMDSDNAYIMVETHGVIDPSVTLEVNVNYQPGQEWEAGRYDDLTLNISGSSLGAWTGSFTNLMPFDVTGSDVKWGSVLEISIPLAKLGNPSYFSVTFASVWTNEVAGINPLTITPPVSGYLADYPRLGALTNTASIASASNSLAKAIDFFLSGMALIRNETDYQADDLIVFDPEDDVGTARAQSFLTQIKESLRGQPATPFTFTLSQFLDLNYSFSNPPDIRKIMTGRGLQQFLLTDMSYQLDFALTHLNSADTNFTQAVDETEWWGSKAPVVDYGDVCMIKAIVTGLKAMINIMGTYNMEADLVPLLESSDIRITDFLADHPQFLTTTNLSCLATASNLVPQTIEFYLAATRWFLDENVSQTNGLFRIAPADAWRTIQTRTTLEGIRDSMNGPVLIDTEDMYETVHLGRFFVSQFVTRAHLPDFTTDNQIIEGTFPDPTFNGILPSNTLWRLSEQLRLSHANDDGDEMPDLWEMEMFGNTTNAPLEDYDKDGMNNLDEYKAGTDPAKPGSVLKMKKSSQVSDGGFEVQWQSSPYRWYDIYRSTNLMTGFSIIEQVRATPPINIYTDRSEGSHARFYRIGVTR
jgi:hypothetical protein